MSYQYLGVPGSTLDCLRAVRLILTGGGFHDPDGREMLPSAATLITRRREPPEDNVADHAFVFWDWVTECTVVPSGFSSGYGGTGPHGLVYALLMLQAKDIRVYELEVRDDFFQRLDENKLTHQDIEVLSTRGQARPLWLGRYLDPISDRDSVKNSRTFDKYLPFLHGASPRIEWELMDQEVAEKCEVLAHVGRMDKALHDAFIILKSRLVERYGVPDTEDGVALVNNIFGDKGVILAEKTDEAEKKVTLAMRDLLAGLFRVFRNRYGHNAVDVPWFEAQAVLWMINCIMIQLDLLQSRARRQAYSGQTSVLL